MARKPSRPVSKPFSASTDVPVAKPRTKKKNLDGANAYTFIPTLPKRHRTSAQTLSLTRDEEELSRPRRKGKDDQGDSDEDMEARIRKVAMMIAQDDKGEVASEESDIDSDEAWEEDGSDEERWGDVFRDLQKGKKAKGKGKLEEKVIKPKKPLTVNLDESEEEEAPQLKPKSRGKAVEAVSEDEEEEEDEEVEDEEEDDEESEGGDESDELEVEGEDEDEDEDEVDDDDDDDESDDGEDLDLPFDLSDDEAGSDTLDGLDAFVDKLAESDKKRKSAQETAEQPKKRRVLPVVAAPALGEGNDLGLKSNQKIDLASLIASHPSLSSASALIPKSKPKSATTNVLNSGVLAAPLPTVVQDRLNREAAYEKTKEEGAKWATMMKRVKEAEHLSFPLQGSDRGGVKSNGEMLSSFKPTNEHESAIQSLLAKANLTETGVKAAEDEALQGKDLSAEEIAERRAALRQQRELMFREEARQKRVAKIKSKTFRKLARKRAAKAGEAVLEDMDEEDALALQEKMERERARERATLKHGAKTGRWAREAEHVHGMGDEYRSARGEMLDIQERLKRRIAGKGDGSEDDDSESDDDAREEDEESIRKRAFDQLDALDGAHEDTGDKGLMGMKFMKKAEERRRQAAREEEAEMRKDIEMFGEDGASGEDDEDEGKDKSAMLKLGASGGRMVFSGPVAGKGSSTIESAGASIPTTTSTGPVQTSRPTQSRRDPSPLPSTEENPWLAASSTAGPSRKRNTVLNANSSAVEKTTAALKKAKSSNGVSNQVDDEAVEIETDGNKLLQQRKRKETVASDDEDEDELLPRKRVGFKQRDLVSEAFAGDNVVQDFAQEKQRVIEEDAPKVEDTSLPGWGSWSGKGAKKRKTNPKFLKTTPGLLATDRKDAKFSNVIISEKKDKKASQFQVKDLPYPYTSVEQYEARFKNPLGSEWNSRGVHQRETMPRVTKKKGAIIEPVRRLF